MEKLSITWAGLKKSVAYKKACIYLHGKVNRSYSSSAKKLVKRNWNKVLVFITCPHVLFCFVCRNAKLRHINTLISSRFSSCAMKYNPEVIVCRCSSKIGVLKNFVNFTGKHLCWSIFFNKVAGLRCFPVKFEKF